jgi:transposase
MAKLWCWCQEEFDEAFKNSGLPDGSCAISIIGTPEVLSEYLGEPETTHALPDGPNVLNLEFDDVTEPEIFRKGIHAYGITDLQAERIVKFLERAVKLNLDIYVHCRAGYSRSQAIVRYVKSRWSGPWETNPLNPDDKPNYYVLGKLREYENKQNIYSSREGSPESDDN